MLDEHADAGDMPGQEEYVAAIGPSEAFRSIPRVDADRREKRHPGKTITG